MEQEKICILTYYMLQKMGTNYNKGNLPVNQSQI